MFFSINYFVDLDSYQVLHQIQVDSQNGNVLKNW